MKPHPMCLDYHDENDFHSCCYSHLSEWKFVFPPKLTWSDRVDYKWIDSSLRFHFTFQSVGVKWGVQAALYHYFNKGIDTFYFQNPLVGGNY